MMTKKEIIIKAVQYVKDIYAKRSDGHDADHSMRVYHSASKIAESYPESDSFVVELAALLHDVDDYKLFNTVNNENARTFMKECGISDELSAHICQVINSVSFSKNKGCIPTTIEGQIVQDADRLDAIGAIGIARTFAYNGAHGGALTTVLRHFEEKLLLLKDMMNTKQAKLIAERRHQFMLEYLNELRDEITG